MDSKIHVICRVDYQIYKFDPFSRFHQLILYSAPRLIFTGLTVEDKGTGLVFRSGPSSGPLWDDLWIKRFLYEWNGHHLVCLWSISLILKILFFRPSWTWSLWMSPAQSSAHLESYIGMKRFPKFPPKMKIVKKILFRRKVENICNTFITDIFHW